MTIGGLLLLGAIVGIVIGYVKIKEQNEKIEKLEKKINKKSKQKSKKKD